MSLFLVNRYLGDDEDAVITKESHSQLLLTKLRRKVKLRQRQSLTKQRERLAEGETQQREVPAKTEDEKQSHEKEHHQKKRKSGVGLLCDTDSNNCDSVVKKKKGAIKGNQTNLDSVQSLEGVSPKSLRCETEVEQELEVPKKDSLGFPVLGGFESRPVHKVKRVLPQWLAEPDVIHRDIKCNLVPISSASGVSTQLLKKLEANGIQHFFPVQAEVIPAILDGAKHGLLIGRGGYRPRDICVDRKSVV